MKKTLKDLIEYIRDNGLVWVNHDECIEFDPIDKIVSDFMEEKSIIEINVNSESVSPAPSATSIRWTTGISPMLLKDQN